MKHRASMHASTARRLGATLKVKAGSIFAGIHVRQLLETEPSSIVILAEDNSIWVWPILPGVRGT